MASLYKKPIVATDPATGQRIAARSRKWWGRYRAASGVERRVPLAADKTAAQAMLNELVRKAERERAGLTDPTDDQRKRPLSQHIEEFEKYLQNKDVTPKQVKEAVTQLKKMVNARKWKFVADITAGAALEYLGGLRKDGRSAQTYNHYLKAAKQFTRWLVRDRRTLTDPLAHLSKLNVSVDRRHDRRALAPDEFARLVQAAQAGPTIEAISGPDRAMMYLLAAWTGFRKGEIGSLSLRSFRLDEDPATATVAACFSKRKREDTQILHPEIVGRLKEWLATKRRLTPGTILFPISGTVPGGTNRKTHKMMRLDIEAAREAWLEEAETPVERKRREKTDFLNYCDDSGLFADFHSNRHLFITNLERAGLSPKMAQTLARHSDIRLTLGVYTHVGLHDQTAAIGALPAPPSLEKPKTEIRAEAVLTGTYGPKAPRTHQRIARREVPKMVPSNPPQKGHGSHQIAPTTTKGATKWATSRSPQLQTSSHLFATTRTKPHQSAST